MKEANVRPNYVWNNFHSTKSRACPTTSFCLIRIEFCTFTAMKIKELIVYLEQLVPKSMQESYDNCGLLVGNSEEEMTGVLLSLDCTEAIVEEAIQRGCNVIVSHHPIIFKGLKSLTGKNYVERTIVKAVQHNVALYAMHTNLDNYRYGVNHEVAERLGLNNVQILRPSSNTLEKLAFFVPTSHLADVRSAVFNAGGGEIGNYSACSFNSSGIGTFKTGDSAQPYVGEKGKLHAEEEVKVELIIPCHQRNKIVSVLKEAHPYEEVAYDIFPLLNTNPYEGAGIVGELEKPVDEKEFLVHLKNEFQCGAVRHTNYIGNPIKRIAFCGGSGIFLLSDAIRAKADIFITSDVKYHEFFDADGQILLADIGHFESEQFTVNLVYGILKKKFTTFAPHLAKTSTNPINYI